MLKMEEHDWGGMPFFSAGVVHHIGPWSASHNTYDFTPLFPD
jgi:hypothetical protein